MARKEKLGPDWPFLSDPESSNYQEQAQPRGAGSQKMGRRSKEDAMVNMRQEIRQLEKQKK
jgi:hypothetical protein